MRVRITLPHRFMSQREKNQAEHLTKTLLWNTWNVNLLITSQISKWYPARS